MKPNPTRSALLVIDMENGFVHPEGGHWIRFAQSMVPNCVRAVELARAKGIPVFFVKRLYRADGSDVELTRYPGWVAGGRACRPASTGPNSAQAPEGLRPQPGDYTIIKPRWSAFFQTELDLILRRLDVRTVILTGTTTPNCIRTTCYDAIALEYNTVVLTDCCSSHTEEIQRVNLEDMARAGAILMDSASFADYGPGTVEDLSAAIRARMLEEDTVPEPFRSEDGQVFWPDLWQPQRKTDALRTTAEAVFLFRVIPSGSGCAGWRSRRRSGRRAPRPAGSADRPAADPPPASGR